MHRLFFCIFLNKPFYECTKRFTALEIENTQIRKGRGKYCHKTNLTVDIHNHFRPFQIDMAPNALLLSPVLCNIESLTGHGYLQRYIL